MKTREKLWGMKNALLLIFTLYGLLVHGQYLKKENPNRRLGVNYGVGTQQSFPFYSDSYTYTTQFFKLNYHHGLTKSKLVIALTIEPSLYFSEFRKIVVSNEEVDAQTQFLQLKVEKVIETPKNMREYALDLGLQMSYPLGKKISTYLLGSIGPMIVDTQTARQKKGFAFSNIMAIGFLYRIGTVIVDFRFGARHVSNAGLGDPNGGYNSSNLQIGFSLPIKSFMQKEKAP